MPLRRATAAPSAPSQPVNTDWQTMALTQGLDWLYPFDGRMAGDVPSNLVSSPPQSVQSWRNVDSEITRYQQLILDGVGYEWRRRIKPDNPSYWGNDENNFCGLRLSPRSSDPDGAFCFGLTLSFPIPEIQPDGSQGSFSREWFCYGSVKGLELSFNINQTVLYGWGGSAPVYSIGLINTNLFWGTPFRLGWQCNPDGQCSLWFNGLRRATFAWNRSATNRSAERWAGVGCLGTASQMGGRGITLRDWWGANGYRDAAFMERMGGL